jgi:hypothetical protein
MVDHDEIRRNPPELISHPLAPLKGRSRNVSRPDRVVRCGWVWLRGVANFRGKGLNVHLDELGDDNTSTNTAE